MTLEEQREELLKWRTEMAAQRRARIRRWWAEWWRTSISGRRNRQRRNWAREYARERGWMK